MLVQGGDIVVYSLLELKRVAVIVMLAAEAVPSY
jgi:hypothetical protein